MRTATRKQTQKTTGLAVGRATLPLEVYCLNRRCGGESAVIASAYIRTVALLAVGIGGGAAGFCCTRRGGATRGGGSMVR